MKEHGIKVATTNPDIIGKADFLPSPLHHHSFIRATRAFILVAVANPRLSFSFLVKIPRSLLQTARNFNRELAKDRVNAWGPLPCNCFEAAPAQSFLESHGVETDIKPLEYVNDPRFVPFPGYENGLYTQEEDRVVFGVLDPNASKVHTITAPLDLVEPRRAIPHAPLTGKAGEPCPLGKTDRGRCCLTCEVTKGGRVCALKRFELRCCEIPESSARVVRKLGTPKRFFLSKAASVCLVYAFAFYCYLDFVIDVI